MRAKAPPFSPADFKSAKNLLEEKRVKNLLFSEGTYQVEIVDSKTKASFFPFLQISDEGVLIDCFCSCSAAEKKRSCQHLAAAWLLIFRDKDEPLHVRFRESLWNQLCIMASHRHGYEVSILKKDEGYFTQAATGKRLFFVTPNNEKGRKRLETLLFQRPVETEETSLKFSNLSPQELTLWKEGRPTPKLRYELSFWSDLAKWWMLLQDAGENYQIEFLYEEALLPKWVHVQFKDVKCGFYLAEVNWPKIIPSLATVNSPLAVSELSYRTIRSMRYLPEKRELHIEFKDNEKVPDEAPQGGVQVGEWLFIPKKGFFPGKLDPLLEEPIVTHHRLPLFLKRHPKLIEQHLEGSSISLDPIDAKYFLFFDEKLSLHLRCYVFEIGDLQKELSTYFGPWVYLEQKGFYKLEHLFFEGAEKIVAKPLVGDFVSRHRHWLQALEGFQTHPSSLESHLAYTLSADGLTFDTRLEFGEEPEEIFDFGEWIYVKGRGFYAKHTGRMGTTVRAGLRVPVHEIPSFIRRFREELEQIPGFFNVGTPVEKSGLKVVFNEKMQILVEPQYEFKKNYREEQVRFFGDFTYVEGEGFCELSPACKLPEAYVRPRLVDEESEPYFVAYELDLLTPFILTMDPRLAKPKSLVLRILQIRRDPKAKHTKWIVDLVYESDVGVVHASEIWKGLNEGKRYLFTSAGLLFIRQMRFNWLKNLSKKRWLKGGKRLKLSTLEWLKLSVVEEMREPKGEDKDVIQSRQVLEEFRAFQTHELIDLTGFQSRLRPYQELGVKWLWFLYCHGLSGLLCDEMGLGKTHQAMGLLASIYNTEKEEKKKFLVVCPTSVIYHWEDLLKRFLPDLKVSVYYGLGRRLLDDFDLLLTSYGTLRSEKKPLEKLDFAVAIFDEIQSAKNPRSQTHRALKAISAEMRIGLTGTPIENRLLELKSLFDLVLPNYLPSDALFKEQFVHPIEKAQDPERKFLLSRLIKPFILRRKKSEVLLELPEKIEEIAYCPLSDEQKKLYKEVVALQRAALENELRNPSQASSAYLHIFALLSTLKQICDHPALYTGKIDEYQKHSSGKWDLFVELLDEVRDSGQKLVVFSQYLGMLDIIERHLNEKKIGFAGIRGSTRNRKEQLDRFRDDPKCEVFVASLQAAGVGVDLVAASVVIHYDRWWNPARENQATDRVHRIGQKRGVQVFKMVTRASIEEHIHALIEKKIGLMEGVIGFDEHDQIKGLAREELRELLQLMEKDAE
ncbi:MAG: DEAD/DEAH box helicase [Chlamydiales bacterium]